MSKAIVVKVAQATMTKPRRMVAKSESVHSECAWDSNLTDYANYHKVVAQVIFEMNCDPANIVEGIRYTVQASALLPDGSAYVFIITD